MTLRRREKQRYLFLVHEKEGKACNVILEKQMEELFGTIASKNASLKLITSKSKSTVIRCSLESLEHVLCAATLANPPMLALSSSGSLSRLKKKMRTNMVLALESTLGDRPDN